MRASYLTLISFVCGFICFAVSGSAMVGILTGPKWLAYWSGVPMAPNTSISLMAAGLGLMSVAVRNQERDKIIDEVEKIPVDKVGLLLVLFCLIGVAVGYASGAGAITVSSGQIFIVVVLSYYKEIYKKISHK